MDEETTQLLEVEVGWKPKQLWGPWIWQERRWQPREVRSTVFEKMNSEPHIFIQSTPENTITINLSLENE